MSEIIIKNIDLSAIPIKHSVWTILRTDVIGTKGCVHDFVTITAYEKSYVNVLKPGEVTNDNYNKLNEQIVHQICQLCNRIEILEEHIIIDHYPDVTTFKTAKTIQLSTINPLKSL